MEDVKEMQSELFSLKTNKEFTESRLKYLNVKDDACILKAKLNDLNERITDLEERVNAALIEAEYEAEMDAMREWYYGGDTTEKALNEVGMSWKDFF